MDVFASFKERAQASMREAMSTATVLASTAMENVKVMSDTVAEDMKILAEDARQKAKALTEGTEEAPAGPKPRDVGINERLIGAVQSLSYASFADREQNKTVEDADEQLAPWQLQHAQVILKECPELESLRFVLCPKRMTDQQFWRTYFLLVSDFLDKDGCSTEAARTSGGAESPGHSADGGKSTAAPSALTAWEDLNRDEAGSAPSPNTAAEAGDDLDKYLQEMLDGDGTGAHEHVGSEAGDLDEYLKELDEKGADANGEFADVDDYLGELNLSDDDVPKQDSPPAADARTPEKDSGSTEN